MLLPAEVAQTRHAAAAVAFGVPAAALSGIQILNDGAPASAVSAFLLFWTGCAAVAWRLVQRSSALFPRASTLSPCAALPVALYAVSRVAQQATYINILSLLSWSALLQMCVHRVCGGSGEPWSRWLALLAACAAATATEGKLVATNSLTVSAILWTLVALAAILSLQALLHNALCDQQNVLTAAHLITGACAFGVPVLGTAALFERGSAAVFVISAHRTMLWAASLSGFCASIWGSVSLMRSYLSYECSVVGFVITPAALALVLPVWPPCAAGVLCAAVASFCGAAFLACGPADEQSGVPQRLVRIFPQSAWLEYEQVLPDDANVDGVGKNLARKRTRLLRLGSVVVVGIAVLSLLSMYAPHAYSASFRALESSGLLRKTGIPRPRSPFDHLWLPGRNRPSRCPSDVPLDVALSVWYSLAVCRACSGESSAAAQCAAVAAHRQEALHATAAALAGLRDPETFCQGNASAIRAIGLFKYRLLCTRPKKIPRCGRVPHGFFAHVGTATMVTWLRRPEFLLSMRSAFRLSIAHAGATVGPQIQSGVCAVHLADPQYEPALPPEDFVVALRAWKLRPQRFRLVTLMMGSSTESGLENDSGGDDVDCSARRASFHDAEPVGQSPAGGTGPSSNRRFVLPLRCYRQAIAKAFPHVPIDVESTQDEATGWLTLVRAPHFAGGYGVLSFAAAAASFGNVTTPRALDSGSAYGKALPAAQLAPNWFGYGTVERVSLAAPQVPSLSAVERGILLWTRQLACGRRRTGACSPDATRSLPIGKETMSSPLAVCLAFSSFCQQDPLRGRTMAEIDAVASMVWASNPARWPSVLAPLRHATALALAPCVAETGKYIPTFKNDTCVVAYEPGAFVGTDEVAGVLVGQQAAAWIHRRPGRVGRVTILSVNASALTGENAHHLADTLRTLRHRLHGVSVDATVLRDPEVAFAAMSSVPCLFAASGLLGRVAAVLSPGARAVSCYDSPKANTGSRSSPCTLGFGISTFRYESMKTAMIMVLPNAYELAPVREWMVRNALDAVPDWPLVIYHGSEITDQLRRLPSVKENPRRVLLKPIAMDNLNAFPREAVLLSRDFWDRLLHWDRVLIITSGTVVCRSGPLPLEKFLRYDYVGAPWPNITGDPFAGNGWTSLRSPHVMQRILEKFPPVAGTRFSEDYYFAEHVAKVGGLVAPQEIALAFTSGMTENPSSLFTSGVGEFKISVGTGLRKACPQIELLLRRSLPGIRKRGRARSAPPPLPIAAAAASRIPRRSAEPPYGHVVALVAVTGKSAVPVLKTLQNFMTHMNLTKWKFQVLAGPTYFRKLSAFPAIAAMRDSKFLELTEVPVDSGPFPEKYNELLLHTEFWKRIVGEMILLIHVDSVICGGSPYEIDGFLKFDYAGAYWPGGRYGVPVGNGGTSLRSRSKTLKLLTTYDLIRQYGLQNEDVLFAQRLPSVGGRVADVQSAGSFACEVHFNSRCLLLHGPQKYMLEMRNALLRHCPDAEFLTG